MHIQLQQKAQLIEDPGGEIWIKSSGVNLKWKKPSFVQRQTLSILAYEGATEDVLSSYVIENENVESLMLFYNFLNRLKHHSLISFTVFDKEMPLLSLEPLSCRWKCDEDPLIELGQFALSPFCFSYSLNDEIVLETPLKTACIYLKAAEMSLFIRSLIKPTNFVHLCTEFPMISPLSIKKCLMLLHEARMLT